MASWTVTYEDGEDIHEKTAEGKLSLDATWAFVIDMERTQPVIVLAVPASRVIAIEEQ